MAEGESTDARRNRTTAVIVGLACAVGLLALVLCVVLPAVRQARAVRLLETYWANVDYERPEASEAGWYDKLTSLVPESWIHLFYSVDSVVLRHDGALPVGYLRLFNALPRVKFVALSAGKLSADDVDILAGVPLAQLNLDDPIDDQSIAQLLRFNRLDELTLDASRLSDAGVARLADLPELEHLTLIGGRFEGQCFGHFRKLLSLKLFRCRLGEGALGEISKIDRLVELRLTGTNVTSIGALKGPKELMVLDLAASRVDDDGLKDIGDFEALRSLDLAGDAITDGGAAHLAKADLLSYLDLSGTQISDAGLKHLAALTNLTTLRLNDTRITDAGLAELSGLPALGALCADGTSVSEAAIQRLLKK